jgi:hypothetical protein
LVSTLSLVGPSKFVSAKELFPAPHKPFDADDHNIRMFNSRGVPTRTTGQALTPRRESVSDDPEVDGFWKRCLAAHPTPNVPSPLLIRVKNYF